MIPDAASPYQTAKDQQAAIIAKADRSAEFGVLLLFP
jgi:hypothetical protein